MNPSKFCDTAINYELTIRGMNFTTRQQAERDLRAAFREERADPTKRPQPVIVDRGRECTDLCTYFDDIITMEEALRGFKDKEIVERIYHRL